MRMLRLTTLLLCVGVATARANQEQYNIALDGSSAGNTSAGVGSGLLTIDYDVSSFHLTTEFSGLEGNTTVAHIHCCTADPGTGPAGVATPTPTFPGFPAGVTAGNYDVLLDMTLDTSYNASYITNNGGTASSAFSALTQGIKDGKAYLNIHTSVYGGGEIRGFLVPEPAMASLGLVSLGLLGLLRSRLR